MGIGTWMTVKKMWLLVGIGVAALLVGIFTIPVLITTGMILAAWILGIVLLAAVVVSVTNIIKSAIHK
jgi:hypothetical protein